MNEHLIPGGPSKGTPLSEADDKSSEYWLKRKAADLRDDPNGKFAADNRSWSEAANEVLKQRAAGGGQPQAAAPTTALQKGQGDRGAAWRLDERPHRSHGEALGARCKLPPGLASFVG